MVPKTPKKCSVCTDPEILDNEIFICIGCNMNVHRLCYGIESSLDENWKCSPCKENLKDVTCKLCLQKEGAFKKTVGGGWTHVICGLFTDGVVFEKPELMEPINIKNVSKNKHNKTCVYCRESIGFCCLCSNSKCNNRLHITCAQKASGLKEVIKKDHSIKFRAFCMEHKPATTERHITSGSVRRKSLAQIEKKKEEKINKMAGSNLNAQWIVAASKNGKSLTNGAFDETLECQITAEVKSLESDVIDLSSKENVYGKSAANGNFDEISQNDGLNGIIVASKKKKESKQKRDEKNDVIPTPKRQILMENRSADKNTMKVLTESKSTCSNASTEFAGKFVNHLN